MSEEPSAETERPETERPEDETPLWRRALPFVVAVGLLAWVFSDIDYVEFVAALRRTNIALYIAFAAVFTVLLLLADAFATAGVYRAVVTDVSTRDVFIVRGADRKSVV